MTDKEKDAPSGRALGGIARAEALSPEARSEIAKRAANARWAPDKVYTAKNRGNFLEQFGLDVECYVLDDPNKTAVISQRGMGEVIGFSRRGSRLKVFANSQTMDGYIGRDLREKLENPIVFQLSRAAAESSNAPRANGYDAAMLIDLCQAILAAKTGGKLSSNRYQKMVEQAQIIVGASAKNGIKQLVYALAGYSPTTDEVIEAFKLYVQEEARKYEAEFPSDLYLQWHRLYQIPVPVRGKPWHFKHLTINHIYFPLAQSSGRLLHLMRALKSEGGDRQKKLFQFLNELGARALRMHLGRVLEMCESSSTREEYESKIKRRFGEQKEFEFTSSSPPTATA